MKKRLSIALLALCALTLTGCAVSAPATIAVPTQTALQRTIVLNDAVAKADNAVVTAVISAQSSGILTVSQVRVLGIAAKVANASNAVLAVTSKSTEASWNVDIQTIRQVLVSSGISGAIQTTGAPAVDAVIALLVSTITLLMQELGV